jgi:hypothetical protein
MNSLNVRFREEALDLLLQHLRQVVAIHHAMFDKLLFDQVPSARELAELFEDAGNTYLQIAEQLNEDCALFRQLNVE